MSHAFNAWVYFKGISMKTFSISVVSFLFILSSAHADLVKVVCAQGRNVARGESVKLMVYQLNTQTGQGTLGCSTRVANSLCGSMRMDLSRFVTGSVLERCSSQNDNVRQTFEFLLTQEDEMDNLAIVTLTRSCRNGAVGADASAVITSNVAGEAPEAAEVVKCSLFR
jgi:hypothetical protein